MSRWTTQTLRSVLLATTLAFMIQGCVISPLPEPPQATLDKDLLRPPVIRNLLTVIGMPGAASPAGATIRAIDLNSDAPPVETTVEPDGSFEMYIPSGGIETSVRFLVLSDESRSTPLDIIVPLGEDMVREVPHLLGDCLFLEPALELDLAADTDVLVTNTCTETVQIEPPTLRIATTDLTIGEGNAWPAVLAIGETLTISVDAGTTFTEEAIFFVDASAPENDRRAITVIPRP